MFHTIRVAIRGLVRSPGFTVTALLTLALCSGASLTIFSVVDSVLLRELPFPDADRLVAIYSSYPNAGVMRDGASPTNYYERRGTIRAFSSLSLYRYGSAIIGDAGATERSEIIRVTPDFFQTLGRGPVLGRSFREEETSREGDNAVILTDAFWRQRFDADPHVIGRTVRIDGVQRSVVGVLPAAFRFLSSRARLYLPYATDVAQRTARERHSGSASEMIARLRPGVSIAQAKREVDRQDAQLAPSYPDAAAIASAEFRSVLVGLHTDHVGAIRQTLLLLQGGVLLLLVIGGVNLTNLLLIRANGRSRDVAIRESMGASKRRIVLQVLVETMVLTSAGGALGLGLAAGGTRLLGILGVDQLPLGATIEFDRRVALAAVVGATALGLLLTIPIAWFHLRSRLAVALRSASRGGTASRSAQQLRHGFVIAQISLAFVLLSGAGLLSVSLDRAVSVSPGFRVDHVLTGQLSLPRASYPSLVAILGIADRLLSGVREQPGVVATGVITNLPLSGRNTLSEITVRGHVLRPGESKRGHFAYGVLGDYFGAIGVPLREGRIFSSGEAREGAGVAVVDEDFARRYWPDASAIGQQLLIGAGDRPDQSALTVVGVVGAVKQVTVTDEERQGAVYVPFPRLADASWYVVTRTARTPELLAPAMQRLVRSLDPDLPLDGVQSMEARVTDSLTARRSPALLAALFAAVALLMAAVGTYGVLSYSVAQRRREIGVRLALGALPWQIGHQFLSLGLMFVAAGTLVGGLGAWMAGRFMQRILFDVPALHVPTLLGSAATLGVVAVVACVLPARRAARVDPLIAMSAE